MRVFDSYDGFAVDHARNLRDDPKTETTFDKLLQALLAGFVVLVWLLVAGSVTDWITEVLR